MIVIAHLQPNPNWAVKPRGMRLFLFWRPSSPSTTVSYQNSHNPSLSVSYKIFVPLQTLLGLPIYIKTIFPIIDLQFFFWVPRRLFVLLELIQDYLFILKLYFL